MWRPENWHDYRAVESGGAITHPHLDGEFWKFFEAGADAMLEALYKECEKLGGKWMRFDREDDGDIVVYLDG